MGRRKGGGREREERGKRERGRERGKGEREGRGRGRECTNIQVSPRVIGQTTHKLLEIGSKSKVQYELGIIE